MKIENKNERTIYSDFEIHKALENLERGISIETFFKHEAKRFEFGEDEYFNMLKKEIEFECRHYDTFHESWEYTEYTLGVSIEELEKIVNNLQKVNIPAPELKPFAGLLKKLDVKQLDKLFLFLTTENKAYSKPTFIDKETDRQSFDYIFGDKDKPNQFISIKWKANKQFLIDLLTGLQKEVKFNKQNPETMELSNEIKRQTELYFIDSETKQGLKLPKNNNRLKDRPEHKAIIKFFSDLIKY